MTPAQSEDDDKTARKLILLGLAFSAKTPRQAYEMAAGKAAREDEWTKARPAWERNWAECVELHAEIEKARGVKQAAYNEYVAGTAAY